MLAYEVGLCSKINHMFKKAALPVFVILWLFDISYADINRDNPSAYGIGILTCPYANFMVGSECFRNLSWLREPVKLYERPGEGTRIVGNSVHEAPPHEPGLLPRWLHELGANVIIAGGMGQRAQQLFAENGITVVVGAPAEPPGQLATAYLSGELQVGENICDH